MVGPGRWEMSYLYQSREQRTCKCRFLKRLDLIPMKTDRGPNFSLARVTIIPRSPAELIGPPPGMESLPPIDLPRLLDLTKPRHPESTGFISSRRSGWLLVEY